MILLLIGVHYIKAPFALALIMMATPPCCTSSFPMHTTFSPLCSVTDSVPFHLVSPIPSTSIPYSFIYLATCPARVVFAMVLTFQQPMIVCRLGATMGPIGFRLALTQERHYSPSSNTPSQCFLIINASGFCNS